jgi:transcriptional regulator of heat shock response
MIGERASKILDATIQGFIETGEPVSSGWLFRRHNFGIRPAMIRRELELLSDEGYLEQPHRSAGRVPTDRGYELFANRLIAEEEGSPHGAGKFLKFFEMGALPSLLEEISSDLGLAGAARLEDDSYKTGIENLIGGFDWETTEEIKSVMRDFAELESRLRGLAGRLFGAPDVFIGKKSPVTRSECLSVVAGSYDADIGKISILAIGPKRMDYKKTIKIFKGLNERRKTARK